MTEKYDCGCKVLEQVLELHTISFLLFMYTSFISFYVLPFLKDSDVPIIFAVIKCFIFYHTLSNYNSNVDVLLHC